MTSTAARPGTPGRALSVPPFVTARAARRLRGDSVFRGLLRGAALVLIGLVVAMVVTMTITGWPAIRAFGVRFLYTSSWDPVRDEFGALPFIYGTLVSSLLAPGLAVPLGLRAAVFLAELALRSARWPVPVPIVSL